MKLYQEPHPSVKESIAPLDANVLTTRASEGLLQLSVELGMEVLRQMLEGDATVLVSPKGKHQEERPPTVTERRRAGWC